MWVKTNNKLENIVSISTKTINGFKKCIAIYEKKGTWNIRWEEPKAGTIVMYEGSLEIPYGWAFCDGSNGTPDLRDRFIMGAVSEIEVGKIGGSKTHTHTLSSEGSHAHALNQGGSHAHSSGYVATGVGATGYSSTTFDYRGYPEEGSDAYHSHGTSNYVSHNHGGLAPAINSIKYYSLAFIIKL